MSGYVPRPRELAPCGTPAAARRHWRHGEKPCEPCRIASNRAHAERQGGGDPYAELTPLLQAAARNGLPIVAYQHGRSARDPGYAWAVANIRRAEALYGSPETDDGAAWDREAG